MAIAPPLSSSLRGAKRPSKSRMSPRKDSRLLGFARNDGVCGAADASAAAAYAGASDGSWPRSPNVTIETCCYSHPADVFVAKSCERQGPEAVLSTHLGSEIWRAA